MTASPVRDRLCARFRELQADVIAWAESELTVRSHDADQVDRIAHRARTLLAGMDCARLCDLRWVIKDYEQFLREVSERERRKLFRELQ